MNPIATLIDRIRGSRPATVLAATVVGLLLSVAGPPVVSALGGLSTPVGCNSSVVGDHSDPCAYDPPSVDSDGGSDDSGGVEDADVVSATPPFTG